MKIDYSAMSLVYWSDEEKYKTTNKEISWVGQSSRVLD